MIDVKRIVQEKELVKQGLLKRMDEQHLSILDKIVELYNKKKELQRQFESKRSEQNSFNEKMAKSEKGSAEFMEMVGKLKELSLEVKALEEEVRKTDQELILRVEVLPNIPDDDVVAGGKESNEVVKTVGEKPKFDFEIKDHVELGESLGMFDFERASKLSGTGFSMYRGMGARLEWALLNYFIEQHIIDGYEMILPPHVVGEMSGYTAGQFPKFKNDVYWLTNEADNKENVTNPEDNYNPHISTSGNGQFLIPTSETPLTNIYRDETLREEELPKRMFAYSPCYRREAGSYRANERGLIRVHQFNKVEMYQYATKEQSQKSFDELVAKAEKLVQGLGLHYRVSKLAAGDCSEGAARTYDIEVWLPAIAQYYEVSSVSNDTDYQSRRGNMRYKTKEGNTEYLYTLNASGLATSRLMVALVESYQNADGSITVPEVLRKYMGVDKIENK